MQKNKQKDFMKEFVEYLIKNLVDYPDEIEVTEMMATSTMVIEMRVAKSDMGKIIGKKGKTIEAIRTLVYTMGAKNRMRIELVILEDDEKK